MKFGNVCIIALAAAVCFSGETRAQSLSSSFTVEGRLYDNTGAPLNASSVDIVLEVLNFSGSAGGSQTGSPCVVYAESWPGVNVSSSDTNAQGVFALPLGQGTKFTGFSNLSPSVFSNSLGAIAGAAEDATGGVSYGAGCTATVNPGDQRVVRIKVKQSTDPGYEVLNPDTLVNSNPAAMVADTLQGHPLTDFLMTDTGTFLSQTNLASLFSNPNYSNLTALLTGTSTQYLGASALTNVNTPTNPSDATNKSYVDSNLDGHSISAGTPTNGEALLWNGTTNQWQAQSITPNAIQSLTGDVTATGPGAATATIATGAVTQSKIAANAVSLSKMNVTGTGGPGSLIMTDSLTGTNLVYETCSTGQVLQWTAGGGWACADVNTVLGNNNAAPGTFGSATQIPQIMVDAQGLVTSVSNVSVAFPVMSVAGHTGAVTLTPYDVGAGDMALYDYGSGFLIAGTLINVDTGTTANKIVKLDVNGALPGVDGYQLSNLNASRIQGSAISTALPQAGQILIWNSNTAQWEPQALGTVNNGGTGLTTSPANGQVLVGNASGGYLLGSLSGTPNQVTVTNNGGGFTFSTAQDLASTSTVQFSVLNLTRGLGIGTSTPKTSLDLSGANDAVIVPNGTSAQYPSTPVTGMIRYNISTSNLEAYVNGSWQNLAGASVSYLSTNGGTENGSVTFANTTSFSGDSTFSGPATGLSVTNSESVGGSLSVTGNILSSQTVESQGANGSPYLSTSNTAATPNFGSTGPALYVANAFPTDNSGAYINLSTRNSLGNTQQAYIAAVSTTGSNYSPALVFGQQTGPNSYAELLRLDAGGTFDILTNVNSSYTINSVTPGGVTSGNMTKVSLNPSPGMPSGTALVGNYYNSSTSPSLTGLDNVSIAGWRSDVTDSTSAFMNVSNMTGGIGAVIDAQTGSGTTSSAIGLEGVVNTQSNGGNRVQNAVGVAGVVSTSGFGSPTTSNAMGLYASVSSAAGTVTNGFGVYIDTVQGTNKWGLYQSDPTTSNYFAGYLGVGTTSPTAMLDVAGQSTAYNFISFSSGATSFNGPVMFISPGDVIVPSLASNQNQIRTVTSGNPNSSGPFGLNYPISEGFSDNITVYHPTILSGYGAVGIGTSSPFAHLDVEGGGGVILNAGSVGIGTSSLSQSALSVASTAILSVSLGMTGGQSSFIYSPAGTSPVINVGDVLVPSNPFNSSETRTVVGVSGSIYTVNLPFSQSFSDNFTVYHPALTTGTYGNVGIGTSSPIGKLDVEGVSSGSTVILNVTRVGVGTMSPQSTLEVNGAARNSSSIVNNTTTIDFSTGNLQYTMMSCGTPMNLLNLKDGGSYMFAVKGATSGVCSFNVYSDSGVTPLTLHLPSDWGPTLSGKMTLFNLMVFGTDVFVGWNSGY